MNNEYVNFEIKRLGGAAVLGLAIGYLTGYWLLSFLIVALGYIGWMLYKLYEIQQWLIHDYKPSKMPDSNGLWEHITTLIHKTEKKSQARKKKQFELMLRFNKVMSALPNAAILMNGDNDIQWSNKAARKLLGVNNKTDKGQRIDNLVRIPALTKLLRQGSEKKIQFQSPINENITVVASVLPVQKGLFLLTARDISQRIQLYETRKAFIANASHELRTPLTVLTGYLELFEGDEELPEHFLPAVKQSRKQTNRMQQIINDMLTLSRLEATEEQQVSNKIVEFPTLVLNLASAIKDTLAQDSHIIHTDIDEHLKIRGKEKDLLSIISNLVENAVKYTPDGTEITISWKRKKSGHACLQVEDNGLGIPQQDLVHLTERFYRVDKGRSRDKGGTGLGLAIVKHALLNHGGYLSIKSNPGRTRFKACFPPERTV